MKNKPILKPQSLALLLLNLGVTLITAQNVYNPPADALTGNYTSGTNTYCGYNVHLNNFLVSNTANYTTRAGNSIKIGNGCSFNSSGGAIFHAYVDPNYNLNGCNNVSTNLVWDNYYTGDGSIVRYAKPLNFQLYPRKSNNKGDVVFAGTTNGVSSITIKVTKTDINNAVTFNIYNFSVSNNKFSYTIEINAELSEYKFEHQLNNTGGLVLIADKVVCGDAYLISGQSNAETGDLSQTEVNNLNISYGTLANNPFAKYGRVYGGTWSHNCGWGVSQTNLNNTFHAGAWGLVIQEKIQETYGIPVCIINGAIGGTSISQHTPSLGGDFFNPITNPNNNSSYFTHLNSRVYHAGLENNIKGILWLQGDGNGAGAASNSYTQQFTPLYNLWNAYFPSFAKGYIVQIPSWVEGGNGNEDHLRVCSDEQRNFPINFSKMKVMSGNGIGYHRIETGHEIHHQDLGYIELANRLFRLIEVDVYGKTSNINDITPPNIQYAIINGNSIGLYFDQDLSINNSDNLTDILSCIKFNTGYLTKSYPSINGNCLSFNVDNATGITKVSYAGFLPNTTNPDYPCYLKNSKNVAALSFHNILVMPPDQQKSTTSLKPVNKIENSPFFIYPNPSTGSFSISDIEDPEILNSIEIQNLLGITIDKIVDLKVSKIEVNVQDQPAGLYLVKLNYPDKVITRKVIKQ